MRLSFLYSFSEAIKKFSPAGCRAYEARVPAETQQAKTAKGFDYWECNILGVVRSRGVLDVEITAKYFRWAALYN